MMPAPTLRDPQPRRGTDETVVLGGATLLAVFVGTLAWLRVCHRTCEQGKNRSVQCASGIGPWVHAPYTKPVRRPS